MRVDHFACGVHRLRSHLHSPPAPACWVCVSARTAGAHCRCAGALRSPPRACEHAADCCLPPSPPPCCTRAADRYLPVGYLDCAWIAVSPLLDTHCSHCAFPPPPALSPAFSLFSATSQTWISRSRRWRLYLVPEPRSPHTAYRHTAPSLPRLSSVLFARVLYLNVLPVFWAPSTPGLPTSLGLYLPPLPLCRFTANFLGLLCLHAYYLPISFYTHTILLHTPPVRPFSSLPAIHPALHNSTGHSALCLIPGCHLTWILRRCCYT